MAMSQDAQVQSKNRVGAQQEIYATWLSTGSRLALLLLLATFAIYVLEIRAPHVPIDQLPELWSLPASEFQSVTGAPLHWEWLSHLHRGDYLTYLGICVLAGTTIACYLRVLALLARQGERLYAAIAVAQVAVLVLAASGFVSGAH